MTRTGPGEPSRSYRPAAERQSRCHEMLLKYPAVPPPISRRAGKPEPSSSAWQLIVWTIACAFLVAPVVAAAPVHAAVAPFAVATAARALRPGELVIVTVRTPRDAERIEVSAWNEHVAAWPVRAGVWRALVGIDLEIPPGRYTIAVRVVTPRAAEEKLIRVRVKPRPFATRRLTVDKAFVNPPPGTLGRIERDERLLREVWTTPVPERLWRVPFLRPVPGAANSRFGMRSIFNGEPRNPHTGADLLSAAGTPVVAPAAGRVRVARDLYFSGNTVVIDHGGGLFSLLAHLSVVDVSEGQDIAAGSVIGRVGATGRVTGPHLHWAVRVSGARIDPISVLALLGKNGRFAAGR